MQIQLWIYVRTINKTMKVGFQIITENEIEEENVNEYAVFVITAMFIIVGNEVKENVSKINII